MVRGIFAHWHLSGLSTVDVSEAENQVSKRELSRAEVHPDTFCQVCMKHIGRKDRWAAFTDRALELLQGLHAERVGSLLKVQHNVNSGTELVGHSGLNMIAESPCASVLSLGVCIQNQNFVSSQ